MKEDLKFSQDSGKRQAKNPLYEATLGNYTWSAYDEVSNNLSLNWYLTDYWTVRGQFSVNRKYSSGERFVDPLSSKTTASPNDGGHNLGDLYVDNGNNLDWNANAALYYTRSFNKHNLNLSVAWEASSEYQMRQTFITADSRVDNFIHRIMQPKYMKSRHVPKVLHAWSVHGLPETIHGMIFIWLISLFVLMGHLILGPINAGHRSSPEVWE